MKASAAAPELIPYIPININGPDQESNIDTLHTLKYDRVSFKVKVQHSIIKS